jgi:hypothetical protein
MWCTGGESKMELERISNSDAMNAESWKGAFAAIGAAVGIALELIATRCVLDRVAPEISLALDAILAAGGTLAGAAAGAGAGLVLGGLTDARALERKKEHCMWCGGDGNGL